MAEQRGWTLGRPRCSNEKRSYPFFVGILTGGLDEASVVVYTTA